MLPAAQAQSYPSGPVKIIVGVGAGSSADVILRVVADHLARHWGQQVVVLNQPGAGGALAIRAAAGSAPPDGATLYNATRMTYGHGRDQSSKSTQATQAGSLSVFKRGGSPVDRVWIPPELHIKNGATELAALAPARPPIGSLPRHPDFRPLLARLSFFAQEPVAAEGGALDPQLLGNV
jgi:hypothetical protein